MGSGQLWGETLAKGWEAPALSHCMGKLLPSLLSSAKRVEDMLCLGLGDGLSCPW